MPYFVGITGASGFILGIKIAEELSKIDKVFLCATETAIKIGKEEGKSLKNAPNIELLKEKDFLSPVASGTYRLKGCIIAPCSMGTLARIANGISSNIIERAADVALKEKWKLIIVPREAPLNVIHLENMLKLAKAEAYIIPPVLTFYHKPQNIDDIINFVVGKVMDCLGLQHNLYKPWKG